VSAVATAPKRLTAEEIGEIYQLRPALVLEYARRGYIPFLRFGRRIRFDLDEVESAIAAAATAERPRKLAVG
jgi:hypothetical protein